MSNRIYLDYNATAPLMPAAAEIMRELAGTPLNASSIHAEGRRARSMLENSRRAIAEQMGAFPAEVIFTASGTESNNWVLASFANLPQYVSSIEHSSVLKAAHNAVILPVTAQGVVDLAALEQQLPSGGAFLVSVMLANNETGVIQPVQEIARLVHARGGLLHCDAAQALGKIPLDFTALGCDFLTLCAHKMGGAVGAAALVAKSNTPISPYALGGGQELNRRAGTENVTAIAGFAEAVKHMDFAHMQQLRGWLAAFEQTAKALGAQVMGEGADRLPNTVCISVPNITAQTQMMRFDLEGISISAGAACTSGKVAASHVLAAMGVDKGVAANAIRVSGGFATVEDDISRFAQQWCSFIRQDK